MPAPARGPQQMWSFPFSDISVAEELHPISISDLGDNLILRYFNLHPQEQSPLCSGTKRSAARSTPPPSF